MTGGLDWNLKFARNESRLDGFLAGSQTTAGGQERKDGSAGKLGFAKEGGEHWRWAMTGDFTSRQFNINDMGYFRRPNDYGATGNLEYLDNLVTSWRRFWAVEMRIHRRWNFDGAELYNSVTAKDKTWRWLRETKSPPILARPIRTQPVRMFGAA